MSRRKENGQCKKSAHKYQQAQKVVARARIYRKTDLTIYKCTNCTQYHVTGNPQKGR